MSCDHSILFADLCGFTEYTCRHGDDVAVQLALAFHNRARELTLEEGCAFVKSIGDAVMIEGDDCRAIVRLAMRILALSATDGYPPIRAGIDTGPVVACDGDWYGATVNTAARVADAAAPGELVVTDRARAALAGEPAPALQGRGIWQLKGLPATRVHAAVV
jgi:class 3 adenylate cyclase